VVSEQICPSCATPNSTFASTCRRCGRSLNPRALPDATTATYEAAPRVQAPASAADGWPVEKLTPSRAESYSADPWAGMPRLRAAADGPGAQDPGLWPRPPVPVGAPMDAPSTSAAAGAPAAGLAAAASDSRTLTAAGEPAAAAPSQPSRPGLSFHLDVAAGSAIAAGQMRSQPAEPAGETADPAPPAAIATLPAAPPHTVPDPLVGEQPRPAAALEPPTVAADGSLEGGPGWGIREGRAVPAAVWPAPMLGAASEPGLPGSPASWSAPAPPPGIVPPALSGAAPWGAPASRRPTAAVGLAVLIAVILAFAGGFWYFTSGPGAAPKLHTISAPPTLGGQPEVTGGALADVASRLQAGMRSSPGLTDAVLVYYGSAASGQLSYMLGMATAATPITSAETSQFVSGFDAATSSGFSLSTAQQTQAGGIDYYCSAIAVATTPASLCVWTDGNVLGSVLGFSGVDLSQTLAAAEEAHGTAEH
jgi:hypothetical protein